VIRVYDAACKVIETHKHKGELREPLSLPRVFSQAVSAYRQALAAREVGPT